jgi:hypothetical protein
MPIVTEDQLPVVYPTWAKWRADRSDGAAATALQGPLTSSCGMCWGQGRIFEPAPNGEGLIPVPCAACARRPG